ncbi:MULTISPECIES: nitrilase-related carbon-nitrogen hydrolase [Streptomyces]|uniref:Nitrilase-related carbon-nitrogen hydrolase n=1 Tax=Streptomyces ramulosus TaxID=47762 RepID=A0ABW1FFQ8_9ACTN
MIALIKPYGVVGLIPTVWNAESRDDVKKNIDLLLELAKGAVWLSSLDVPVRLLVLPEGALQGFTDEIHDMPTREYAQSAAIDIPGPETDILARFAREQDLFILGQAKARHPDWPELFFNVGFLINPAGEIVLKHYKMSALLPVERSVSPHDLYDWWIEKYGRELQSFWPVADTEIGRIGVMMAMEGNFPENGRGLAMNGAEVVYRASLPVPMTANGVFEVTNRARALENNFYVVAPNIGGVYLHSDSRLPADCGGGTGMIVNYRGQVVGEQANTNGPSFVSGVVDIEALRHHRTHAKTTNWLKDVRAETAQLIYEKPLYPANLYLSRQPGNHAAYAAEILNPGIDRMVDADIWRRPGYEETEPTGKSRQASGTAG